MKLTLLEQVYSKLQDDTKRNFDIGYTVDPDCNTEDYAGRRLQYPQYTVLTGSAENVYIDISLDVSNSEGVFLGSLRLGDIHIKNHTGKVDAAVCTLLQDVADATEKVVTELEQRLEELAVNEPKTQVKLAEKDRSATEK